MNFSNVKRKMKIIMVSIISFLFAIVMVNATIDSINISSNTTVYQKTNLAQINFTIYNDIAVDINYSIFINNIFFTSNTTTNGSFVRENLTFGGGQNTYNIYIEARDNPSNGMNSTTINITYDSTAPYKLGNTSLYDIDGYIPISTNMSIGFNLTDAKSTINNVTINLTSLGCEEITINTSINGLWKTSCFVSSTSSSIFSNKTIHFSACDIVSNCMNIQTETIKIFDFTYPSESENITFDRSVSTNLSQESNLTDVNYILGFMLNGSEQPGAPWNSTKLAATISFDSIDVTTTEMRQLLNNISQSISLIIRNSKNGYYGGSKIWMNTSLIPSFATNNTVTLHYLPFTSLNTTNIINETGPYSFTSYIDNGDGSGNLTFDNNGSWGFNISESFSPVFTFNSISGNTWHRTFYFDSLLNGTGTEINISSVLLTLQGTQRIIYINQTNMSCSYLDNREILHCSFNLTIVNDYYNITLFAKDYSGDNGLSNTVTRYNVYLNDNVPFVNMVTQNDTKTKNVTPTLNFSIDDKIDWTLFYFVWVDNVYNGQNGIVIKKQYNLLNLSTLNQGVHKINIEAVDLEGNRLNSTTLYITVDTTSPTITINTPTQTTSDSTPLINFSINDALDSVLNYTIYTNGNISTTGNIASGVYTTELLNLPNGTNYIRVEAFDDAGNYVNSSIYITIDQIKPRITINSPVDNFGTTLDTVFFNFSVYDDSDPILDCNITIDDNINFSTTVTNNGTYNFSVQGWSVGTHFWNVTCYDSYNYSNTTQTFALSKDTTSPILHFTNLSDYYVRTGQLIFVTVNTSDSQSNISSVYVENTLLNQFGLIWNGSYNVTNSTEGTVKIRINTTNNAGLSSIIDINVTVDNTAPSISQELINNGSVLYLNQSPTAYSIIGNVTFNWTINEINISYSNISIDNGVLKNRSESIISHMYFLLQAGLHNVTFTAVDEAGNINSTNFSFRIDRLVNVPEIVNQLNQTIYPNITEIVFYNETDDDISNLLVRFSQNISFRINLSVDGDDVVIRFPKFYGLDANWNQTFLINTSSSEASNITVNNLGLNLTNLILIQNLNLLIADNFYDYVNITFNSTLSEKNAIFVKSLNNVSRITQECSGTYPCYSVNNNKTTLTVSSFLGAGLANDSVSPQVSISAPASAITSGYSIDISGYVFDKNPMQDLNYMCLYNIDGLPDKSLPLTEINNFNRSFSLNYATTLANGNHQLYIRCNDTKENSGVTQYTFNINDLSYPILIYNDVDDIRRDSATIEFATDEPASYTIEYGDEYTMDDTPVSNSNRVIGLQSISLTNLKTDTTYYYNISVCDINSLCHESGPYIFGTLSRSLDEQITSSGGSGWSPTVSGIEEKTITKSMTWPLMKKGTTIMKIDDIDMGIDIIKIQLALDVKHGKLTIIKLNSRANIIPLTKKTYRIFEFNTENIPQSSLVYSDIDFHVSKKWLTSNELGWKDISLYRFYNGVWTELASTIIDTNSDYIYYRSRTPGFSYFAIAEKTIIITTTQPTTTTTPSTTTIDTESPSQVSITTTTEVPNPEKFQEDEKDNTPFKLTFTLAIIIICLIIGIVLISTKGINYERHKKFNTEQVMVQVRSREVKQHTKRITHAISSSINNIRNIKEKTKKLHPKFVSSDYQKKRIRQAKERMKKIRNEFNRIIGYKKVAEDTRNLDNEIKTIQQEFNTKIDEQKLEAILTHYEKITQHYNNLNQEGKNLVYPEIMEIIEEINNKIKFLKRMKR